MSKRPYAQQRQAHQENTGKLLHDLWHHAPLSRAMLAERNGLTKATVSSICQGLTDLGLIRLVGIDRNGMGRPGTLLELDPSARSAIGVEISTNYSAVVLTSFWGEALWHGAAWLPADRDEEAVLSHAEPLVARAIAEAGRQAELGPLLGIGLAVPGAVDPGEERLVTAPAMGWKDVALKERYERCFGLPVVVDNKARAAAVAEALHGSAEQVEDFVYVSLGTGVGSTVQAAVMANGRPFEGAHGMAVDAGHMILDPRGPVCACGQRGCWQAMANVAREVDLILPRLAAGEPSVLQGYDAEKNGPLDHQTIHQAAMEGDRLALDVVREVNDSHTLGITNLVRLFDPEMVVIGWASAALPDAHLTRMQTLAHMPELDVPAAVTEYLSRRGIAPPRIVYARYLQQAATLGAATLMIDNFLRNPPMYEV